MEADQFPTRPAVNRHFESDDEDLENEVEYEEETDLFHRLHKKQSKSRRKRQAPYIIFPEILCIVDYDGYR